MRTTPYVFDERLRAVATGRRRYHHSMTSRPRPRRIIFVLLMTLAALLVCWGLWLWVAHTWHEWYFFRTAARTAGATVVSRSSDTSTDTTTYYVTYEFRYVPADGDPLTATGSDSVSWRTYNAATPGSELAIFYDPADPSRSYADPPTILRSSLITLAAICMLPFVLLLLRPLLKSVQEWMYQRNRWLQPIGQLCHGTINRITLNGGQAHALPADELVACIHYSFINPTSKTISDTQYRHIRSDDLPEVGMSIAIWYIDSQQYTLL